MKILILSIIIAILSLAIAFTDLAFIGYCIVFLAALGTLGAVILLLVEDKFKSVEKLVSLIILILVVLFSYRGYSLVRGYYMVTQELKKDFGNQYKIVGVSNKKFYYCYNKYHYAYKVKLQDNSDIIFNAAYGTGGIPIPSANVCYDYENYYVPYYLEKYKQEHQSSFTYKIKKEEDGDNTIHIEYSGKDKRVLYDFFAYLQSKDYNASYHVCVYNVDTKKELYIHSWNDDYKEIISYDEY